MKREKHILAYIADDTEGHKAINEEDHSINFVISTDKVDRDNEIVEVAAVAAAIKDFAKNPVALTYHRHQLDDGTSPVIGVWDTDSFRAFKHHSEMRLRFAVGTDKGAEYWYLYSNRFQKAVSIGFWVLDGAEEKKDNIRYYRITKIELFEISCVPVGANRQALSKTKEIFGDLPELQLQELILSLDEFKTQLTKTIQDQQISLEDKLTEISDLLIPDSDAHARQLLFGAAADPAPSAGDKAEPEQILAALRDAINQYLK